jgi:molybdate transport repressor ModE-like protein
VTDLRQRWLGVEVRHLEALAAVAREGSFQNAADSLGYVQSAISQQIAQLEQLAGTRLVERARGSTHIEITEAGQLLLEHVDAILERLRVARDDLEALDDGRSGTVRVASIESVAARVFPHVLPTFARAHPNVHVAVSEGQTDAEPLTHLDQGEVDLAFCEMPLPSAGYEHVELLDDPYVLLVSSRSPFADREEAPALDELTDVPLIGFNESRTQDRVLAALAEREVHPHFAHRSDLNSTVQALVAADLGVAIVPFLCVDPLHDGTTVLELPDLVARTIALAWPEGQQPSGATQAFIDTVSDVCAHLFRHAGAKGQSLGPETERET